MRTYCIWMSHVIYEWVMSRMNESWTLDGITSLEEESNESYKTSMSHVTYMNESCHRHGWVMDTWWDCLSRGDIYRVMSHMNESCHIYGWGMDTWWQSLSEDACKEESRCVAVCCSVLQFVVVYCSVLQCVPLWRMRVKRRVVVCHTWMSRVAYTNDSWTHDGNTFLEDAHNEWVHSRKRSDFRFLISRFFPFFLEGLSSDRNSIHSREKLFPILGNPRQRVWYIRGPPWKLVPNFGSRNYFKSDLLRAWHATCGFIIALMWIRYCTYEWVMDTCWQNALLDDARTSLSRQDNH